MFVSQRRQIYSKAERRRRMEQAVTSLVAEGFMLGYTAEIVEQVERQDARRWRRRGGQGVQQGRHAVTSALLTSRCAGRSARTTP